MYPTSGSVNFASTKATNDTKGLQPTMKTILLPCADGTDHQCHGMIPAEDYSDSYFDLSDEQQDEIEELAGRYTRDDGDFEEEVDGIYVKIAPAVCVA